MAKTTVTLKNGKTIQVMPREVEGLKKAGLLRGTETAKEKAAKEAAEALLKEEKADTETKEFKADADTETKEEQQEQEKSKQRPVNISAANVKIAKK